MQSPFSLLYSMRRRSLACHRTSRASPSTEEENANLFFRSTGRFLVVVVVVVILGNNLEVFLKIFLRVFPNNTWSIAVVRYRGRSDHTEYLKRSIVAAKVYEKSPALSKQLSSHLPWIIQIYKQYCRLCSTKKTGFQNMQYTRVFLPHSTS